MSCRSSARPALRPSWRSSSSPGCCPCQPPSAASSPSLTGSGSVLSCCRTVPHRTPRQPPPPRPGLSHPPCLHPGGATRHLSRCSTSASGTVWESFTPSPTAPVEQSVSVSQASDLCSIRVVHWRVPDQLRDSQPSHVMADSKDKDTTLGNKSHFFPSLCLYGERSGAMRVEHFGQSDLAISLRHSY